MNREALQYISAGELFITPNELSLKTVCTFGLVLCFFHPEKKFAGFSHFLYVENPNGVTDSSTFGRASLCYLFKEMREYDLEPLDFEFHLYGAAIPKGAGNDYKEVVESNLNWINQVFASQNIAPLHIDVGGNRARKIVFNTATGECIVAKVNQVRTEDWVLNYSNPVYRESDFN